MTSGEAKRIVLYKIIQLACLVKLTVSMPHYYIAVPHYYTANSGDNNNNNIYTKSVSSFGLPGFKKKLLDT